MLGMSNMIWAGMPQDLLPGESILEKEGVKMICPRTSFQERVS